jgi:hypothetical protein
MSFVIVNDRAVIKASSAAYLQYHIKYLSNKNHPDHKDKVEIFAPSLANVFPVTIERFIQLIVKSHIDYLDYREGKLGKRTSKSWDETIYRTPDHTKLSEKERKLIERKVLSIRSGEPAFLQWHFNKIRESWDLHVLSPVKSIFWPYKVILSCEFGNGKSHILNALEELDDELADELNLTRAPDEQIISMRERKRIKAKEAIGDLPSLAEEIAMTAEKSVTRDNLAEVIESLGHEVTRPPTETSRYTTIRYKNRKQKRRHNVDDLLLDIFDLQQPIMSTDIKVDDSSTPPTSPPPQPSSPLIQPAHNGTTGDSGASSSANPPKPKPSPTQAGTKAHPPVLPPSGSTKMPGKNRQRRSGRPSGNDDPPTPSIS